MSGAYRLSLRQDRICHQLLGPCDWSSSL